MIATDTIKNIKIALFLASLMLAVGNAAGAPLNVELTGRYYYGLTSDPNFRMLATFEYDQQQLGDGLGQFQLDALRIEFFPPFEGASSLGKARSAFTLVADTNQSAVYFYPSSASSGLGYVRFSGSFQSGMNYFPNGLQALTYDIPVAFAQMNVDNLTTLPLALPVPYNGASIYIATQGGAYSDAVSDPVFQISSIPEPKSYAMILAGLGLLNIVVRRRKK